MFVREWVADVVDPKWCSRSCVVLAVGSVQPYVEPAHAQQYHVGYMTFVPLPTADPSIDYRPKRFRKKRSLETRMHMLYKKRAADNIGKKGGSMSGVHLTFMDAKLRAKVLRNGPLASIPIMPPHRPARESLFRKAEDPARVLKNKDKAVKHPKRPVRTQQGGKDKREVSCPTAHPLDHAPYAASQSWLLSYHSCLFTLSGGA